MPNAPIGRIINPKCANPLVYTTLDWCGRIRDVNGPWGECVKIIDQGTLKNIFENCVSDICALENMKTKQTEALCEIFEQIVDACYDLGRKEKFNWRFLWRDKTQCGIL